MPKLQAITDNNEFVRLLAERMFAQSKVPNLYGYSPMDKQKIFHEMMEKIRLYIGGNRSGKTTGGVVEDLWWAIGEHPFRKTPPPPIRGRVIGVDFLDGIEKILLPEFSRWVPPSKLRGNSWSTAYDKQARVLNFENESFIEFMSYDQDLDKFAGTSRHFIHFDEEPPEDIWIENQARVIDTDGDIWLTMTPVEGMTWVFDRIYTPGIEKIKNIGVVEVDMGENIYLSPTAVEQFLDSLSDDERKIRGSGKFVQMGGLIFKDFKEETHVVEPREIPKDWLWIASLDHGYNNPTAWLWHAVGPEDQIITFKEHYLSGMTIDDHAKTVHQINQELGRAPDFYIGDPSIRNTDPITATSIHQEYAKFGIPIVLGNNDVRAGIIKVARYLKVSEQGRPNYVVSSDCKNLIREFSRYRWKTFANKRLNEQSNVQEAPVKKDDHALDSLRYFIMSRPDLIPDLPGVRTTQNNPLGYPSSTGPNGLIIAGRHIPTPKDSDFKSEEYGDTQWGFDEHMGGYN